jgi:3-oxoacyl-[acyl-carrier protein] reductase
MSATVTTTAPVAIVTGGSRGLGADLVERFLQAGHAVASCARAESAAVAGWRARFGERRFFFEALDLADAAALPPFVGRVLERLGRVDVLVNNAALGSDGLLSFARPEAIDAALAVNLRAAIQLAQLVSRPMLRQGSGCIVNVSSVNALRGHAGVAVYSATKAALDGLTRSLARELGPKQIRVNSVAPGYFDSQMAEGLDQAARERIVRRTPLGRLGTVSDVSEAVLWLCSPAASFVTGQVLVVDGGLTC